MRPGSTSGRRPILFGWRDPGPKHTGLGSGLVGDFIGDTKSHGGSEQAVDAFAREDLDDWQGRLHRDLPNGFFGDNLTIRGLDVTDARIGERWRIGDTVELQVTSPRIPCSTFRGWVGEVGWLKLFTQLARPGAYLSVVKPGEIKAGDKIEIVVPTRPRRHRLAGLPRPHAGARAAAGPAGRRRGPARRGDRGRRAGPRQADRTDRKANLSA
jgi:MOSC domain-containing protein YiiM